jgi:hypothetical protein
MTTERKTEKASDWQPMEAAPTDGTEVLAVFLGKRIIAKFNADSGEWIGLNCPWYDGSGGYVSLRDGWGQGGPTCWQPLPEPPATHPAKEG